MNYILILSMTAIIGLLLTPLVIKFAKKFGFVDLPNERKVHTKSIPRLGGLSIYASFICGLIVLYFKTDLFNGQENLFHGLLISGTIIAIVGMLDDKIELSAKNKLLGQAIAAGILILFGIKTSVVTNPFGEGIIELGMFAIPITVIWILGITNAINLIDGLDGLAGGVSGIASLSIATIAFMSGKTEIGFLALLLFASLIGFMVFNFHPAKIFMGDVGSLFLGFILSVLTLQELKQVTLLGILVPVLLLAIPILDTFYAIVRRKMNHKPIFQADKNHLHHRLLSSGFSHKSAVLFIYAISLSFAVLGILIPYLSGWLIILLVLLLLVVFQLIANDIGMIKEKETTKKPESL